MIEIIKNRYIAFALLIVGVLFSLQWSGEPVVIKEKNTEFFVHKQPVEDLEMHATLLEESIEMTEQIAKEIRESNARLDQIRALKHSGDLASIKDEMIRWLTEDYASASAYLASDDLDLDIWDWLTDGLVTYLQAVSGEEAMALVANAKFNDSMNTKVIDAIFPAWFYEENALSKEWIASHLELDTAAHVCSIAGRISGGKHDLAEVDWIFELPEHPARARAIASAFEELIKRNHHTVATLLNNMPSSADLDETIYHLAHKTLKEAPEVAMTWAMSIHSEELRNSSIIDVASEWGSREPEAYLIWRQRTDLPDTLAVELP